MRTVTPPSKNIPQEAPVPRELKRVDASGERVSVHVDGLCAPVVRSVDEALALMTAAKAARLQLPVCPACANWTRELDTFWTLYFASPTSVPREPSSPTSPGAPTEAAATEAAAAAAAPEEDGAAVVVGGGADGGGGSDGGATAAAVEPAYRWLGNLTFVNLAACGRRYLCSECKPPPAGNLHGMSSLSLVVGQLADGKSRYVSYRDAPTTELLQDALGGRAKTSWLTHLIPGRDAMDYDENRASLQLAKRVMAINNRPQKLDHGPLGLAPDEANGGGEVAEEKELAELQRLLTSGPTSRRAPRA